MKKLLFVFIAVICFVFPANAQKDYTKELHKELVKITNSNYVLEEFNIVTYQDVTLQFASKSTCPTSVMSRDMFVSMNAQLNTMFFFLILHEAGISFDKMDEIDIKEIDELIGDPDITFNYIMTKNGIQIQTITDEGKENFTMTWTDFFAE